MSVEQQLFRWKIYNKKKQKKKIASLLDIQIRLYSRLFLSLTFLCLSYHFSSFALHAYYSSSTEGLFQNEFYFDSYTFYLLPTRISRYLIAVSFHTYVYICVSVHVAYE